MILQHKMKSKKAFSMVTAIFVILIMASITALIMNVSGKTIQETTQQYQKEQAALLARSYTEQAILYLLHYDRIGNGNCINQINATFGDGITSQVFTIQTNMQYVSNNTQLPNPSLNPNIGCRVLDEWIDSGITGFNSSVSVIVDVYVTYSNLDDPLNRPITFHKRTLQKL